MGLTCPPEDSKDWVEAQAELNLPWVHMALCWFCRVKAYITISESEICL